MKKNMEYNIFLDDSRTATDMGYKFNNPIYNGNIITIKNYQTFVEYIEEQYRKDGSYPGFISFDYLLSTVTLSVTEDKSIYQNPESYQETGIECAIWIVNFCKQHNLPIPKYFIHDDNGWGKKKISKAFTEQPKFVKDPFEKLSIVPVIEKVIEETPILVEETIETPIENLETKSKKINFESLFEFVKTALTDSSKSRKELDEILFKVFPPDVSESIKNSKINNLLYLYKSKGLIKSVGPKRKSVWVLTENQ